MRHPGLMLADKIKASGFLQTSLASQLKMPVTSFNEALHGKRYFTAEQCVKMQAVFGNGKELWQQQADYQYWKALQSAAPTPQQEGADHA